MASGGQRWWGPLELAFYARFGQEVAEARKRLGMTLTQLAEKLDYSESSLNGIEAGKQAPTAFRYVQLVSLLGLSVPVASTAPMVACCEEELMGIEGSFSHGLGCTRRFVVEE